MPQPVNLLTYKYTGNLCTVARLGALDCYIFERTQNPQSCHFGPYINSLYQANNFGT